MPDLAFHVEGAEPEPYAAAPLLQFKVRITESGGLPIHSIALRCQIRIEPTKRHYTPAEQTDLRDLFDRPERWGQTLRSLLWTHANAVVPPFVGTTVADLPVPCSFDFNVATTKYFDAMEAGEVPIILLFSGTVFHEGPDGRLQVEQIPWDKEARFRLPVAAWKKMMELYYPNSAWLCLRKDAFDRLHDYKRENALATWEQAIEALLQGQAERVMP